MKRSVLFLGTPQFALLQLQKLADQHEVVGVVTQPDRPVGRKQVLTPPPVKTLAQELSIPVYQPEKIGDLIKEKLPRFDFLVTSAYGQYLPSTILSLPQKDALNIHPSLLPLYRGATPIQSALLDGQTKTGVSIIRMIKKMDAGPIFTQEEVLILDSEKYTSLEQKCSAVGARLINDVLQKYESITPLHQDENIVSLCSKIQKKDGDIKWSESSAEEIHHKLRAFEPWPGVFTWFKSQKLSLLDFTPQQKNKVNKKSGEVFIENEKLFIACKKGVLELHSLQLAGKKAQKPSDFLNGYPQIIGAVLGEN